VNRVAEKRLLGDRVTGRDTSRVPASDSGSFPREADKGDATLLSVVVPLYNEEVVVREFHRRLVGVLDKISVVSEVIYINDGSTDTSLQVLNELRTHDDRIAIINLSRNFGKEVAVTAGLDYAHGDAVVLIDADLQDPPELILSLVEKWKEGNDVVYAIRRERRGETWIKRATADMFYRVMENIAETPIPRNAGDFRLMDKRCIAALAACRERRRFMKGLFAWVGFKQIAVTYDRDPRFAGTTKWNYWRLWNFAIEGITSFTIAPLKLATYFGLLTAFASLAYGTFIICRTALLGRDVPGYASMMVVILFLAGAQLTAIGVIGEYVGRIFVETKSRPLYLIDACIPSRNIQHSMEERPRPRGEAFSG
jgi:glycosyltransferase involved in cell wall biosynthesis